MVGFSSVMNYINMPAVVARALLRNDPANKDMSHADSNRLILAVMKAIHKSRRDLNATDFDNTQNTTAVDPTSHQAASLLRNGRQNSTKTRAVTRNTKHDDVRR